MPEDPIRLFLFLFTFFSIAGWGLECVYRSTAQKKPVNPGFLKGPYLPLYGTAAVILTPVVTAFQQGAIFPYAAYFIALVFPGIRALDASCFTSMAFLTKGLAYFVITTGIELAVGLFFGGLLKRPLWDYSGQPLCFKNHVCLKYSCYWVLLAFFFEYALLPLSLFVYRSCDPRWMSAVTFPICFILFLDFIWNLSVVLQARGKEAALSVSHDEFMDILAPLLDTADVQRLSGFRHHGFNTRLEHSLEVAWRSYAAAKTLSLDYASTARGALLHDLFFYDWTTEGPRLHGYRHPKIALQNAVRTADLNKKEKDIIRKHMWPLTLMPPRYLESWVVCFVDTCCSIKDCIVLVRKFRAG
ncbi:MAG: phosphohydrolase [Thermodesulfobacteriota bacterium]|nr:phosphohydrolase [Thermodesulfobacteriota bacterium]